MYNKFQEFWVQLGVYTDLLYPVFGSLFLVFNFKAGNTQEVKSSKHILQIKTTLF